MARQHVERRQRKRKDAQSNASSPSGRGTVGDKPDGGQYQNDYGITPRYGANFVAKFEGELFSVYWVKYGLFPCLFAKEAGVLFGSISATTTWLCPLRTRSLLALSPRSGASGSRSLKALASSWLPPPGRGEGSGSAGA